jgi:hypothetical protein
MGRRKNVSSEGEIPLDRLREKRGRGRPNDVDHTVVYGRAENFRQTLGFVWNKLRGPLLAATTVEEVIDAFERKADAYSPYFVPRLAEDILKAIHEPKFPKRPDPQLRFLADSLAGRPEVEPRTSRDICVKEKAKQRAKSKHKILRKEFYVECSCGYKGPAMNDACRKCGAEISILPDVLFNS